MTSPDGTPMDGQTEILLNAGKLAGDFAQIVRDAQTELNNVMSDLIVHWKGSAPVVFQNSHQQWDTGLTAAATSLDDLGVKVTGAAHEYQAGAGDANQAVSAVEVPAFQSLL